MQTHDSADRPLPMLPLREITITIVTPRSVPDDLMERQCDALDDLSQQLARRVNKLIADQPILKGCEVRIS